MGRFNGVPVPEDAAPEKGRPRFKGEALPPSGKHYTFEEGQALLNKEDQAGAQGTINAFGSGFADGIPIVGPAILGGLKKAGAGIASMIDGESYDTNLRQGEQIISDAQEQHPITTIAGNVAGGITGTAPLIAAAPAAFGLGAGSVPVRAGIAALSGGAIGAADGGVRNGLQGAAIGGGAGLVLGAAGPIAGNAFGQAYRSLAGRAAETEAARLAGTSRPAVNVVARALGADNATGATNQNIAAAGPRAMLGDAGPSTLSVLDTAIQRGGPNAGRAAQRIGARAEGATQDINAALDTALGPAQGMVRPLEELRTASQPARHAAYEGPNGAYAQSIDYADPRGQALERMIRGRVPPEIISRANKLMRVDGHESQQILANIGDDGTVTFERLPDVRQIDYITRALNDVSRAGDGAGALGGNTTEGRAYGGLSREIRNITSALVPEYRVALDTAAEPIAQREAALFGQRILSPAVARDEVEGFVAGMSDAELRSLRGGIRSKVSETLANVKRSVTDPSVDARQGVAALRDLSSDAAREKLATVLGQREADGMFRAIDEAARSFELRAGVTANSRTYARQAAERAVNASTAPGILETAAQGKPLATTQSFLQRILGSGPEAQLGRQDAAWGDIADLLTQPAGQAGGTFLQSLQNIAGRLPIIDRNADRVTGAVARGFGVAAPQGEKLRQISR